MADRTCSVPGCDRIYRCRGFCNAHYQRWKIHGDPGPAAVGSYRKRNHACSVDECDRDAWSRGLCSMHYSRNWRHGHPTEVGHKPAPKSRPIRDGVTYNHVHRRIRAELGRACDRLCQNDCGRQAQHWAYDHADPDEKLDADGFPYSIDFDHYWALCASCHGRLDRVARYLRETGQIHIYAGTDGQEVA